MQRKSIYQYASLALPLSFVGLPLYLYIPDLYATQYGLSLTMIGVLLLGIRFIDAFQDPIIGALTSKTLGDKSKLRKLFIGVFVALILSMFLLLNPPAQMPIAIWFALSMILCTTAFSVASIVYQALGAVWKNDYNLRTKITATREGLGLVGVMLAAILPTALSQIYDPKTAFQIFFFIFAALMLAVALLWLKWLKNIEFEAQAASSPISIFAVLKLKSTRPLYFIWFLSQFASAIPVVLVIFYVRDRLELEHLTGLFLLVYFLSGVLGMPLWQFFQRLWNKQTAWLVAMVLGIISFLWAYFLQSGDAVQYLLVCVFSGLALGGELAIPPSILADKIAAEKASADSTKFFAISTLLGKFALALASGIVLPLLAYLGYSAIEKNGDSELAALAFSYALLPCIIKIIAAIFLCCIKLEGEKNELNK